MKQTPAVSVIIPVYNDEEYLNECLDSILSQTLKNIEIICIDDGSTDTSLDILQVYAENDKRIIVEFQNNCGAAIARNKGLSIAKGEYIAFMDSDDMYPNDTVLEYMYLKAKDNNASVCGGGISNFIRGQILSGKELGDGFYYSEEKFVDYKELQIDYGYTRYLYLRSVICDNNIKFPNLLRFQDPPFFVQVMLCAERIYTITIDTYLYRKKHKKVKWTFRKVNDLVRGLTLELVYCQDNNLDKLYKTVLKRFNEEYYSIIKTSIASGNTEIMKLLFNASLLLNKENSGQILLFEEYFEQNFDKKGTNVNTRKYQDEISRLKKELEDTRASLSFRIGRIITFVPRKIRSVYRCYREHGFRYTWNEFLRIKRK